LTQRLVHEGAVVSQGLAPVPHGAPVRLADAITAGSHAAFMTGLHTTMLVAGFVALIGAGMGPLLRSPGPAGDEGAVALSDLEADPQSAASGRFGARL
jgi:hypothetical protein